ncbi:GntT/GntP/DsdX family permease [Actinotignum sp. GS-2025b]|uniref:GntT/GntP/DsdX family permease n=1 Tax=Actinotignum sp. GS-2025b TaxID=3427275 RepID=UPI003F487743
MNALLVGVSQLQSSIPQGLLPFARDIPEVSLNPAALLISIVTGVAILIILVSWAKVHPFLAIMLAALITGIGSGFGLMNTVHAFLDGFGDTTKSVGILVGIGAMLGAVLMVTGATGVLVDVRGCGRFPRDF